MEECIGSWRGKIHTCAHTGFGHSLIPASLTPRVSSSALLPLNRVCLETPCGTQMAAAPPHPSTAGARAKQNCPHILVSTHIGPNWVTSPVPEPISTAWGMGSTSWANHPNNMIGRGLRVVSRRRAKATGRRKRAMQDKADERHSTWERTNSFPNLALPIPSVPALNSQFSSFVYHWMWSQLTLVMTAVTSATRTTATIYQQYIVCQALYIHYFISRLTSIYRWRTEAQRLSNLLKITH